MQEYLVLFGVAFVGLERDHLLPTVGDSAEISPISVFTKEQSQAVAGRDKYLESAGPARQVHGKCNSPHQSLTVQASFPSAAA